MDSTQAGAAAAGGSLRSGPAAVRWALVVLVLLAFGLRAYDLGGREFWFDEALTANVSALGWQGIVEHLRRAPFEHPPLYFLALYPWQQLAGTSEYAFRLASVFWGVLFVPLLYLLVRRWAARPVALLAALLAVISPFLVAYSQEARMYTVLPCLAALAFLVFARALERERRPAWWLGYLALLVVGTATHYFFSLLGLVTALYLAVDYARSRRSRPWAFMAHALLLLAGVVWLVAAPGLRASLVRLAEGEAVFGLAYKLNKIMPTLILSEVSGGQVPLGAHLLAVAGWLLVLWGAWSAVRWPILREPGRLLLLLTLVVPLVAALLLPYGVLGRHLGYLMVPLLAFLAAGLVALRRRGWVRLAGGILLLLLPTGYGLAVHYGRSSGDFAQAMAYVDRHAQPGDLLILNQPAQEPLVTYYNRGGWPVHYLPAGTEPPAPEYVDQVLTELSGLHGRLWLGPIGAWTADPDLLAERWLAANAFPALKTWFADSSSVALYYTAAADLKPVEVERAVWGGRLRLQALAAGSLEVPAGDALRLQFAWLAGPDLDKAYAVDLRLVDGVGMVWAERYSEPCGGWCPTEGWPAGESREDRHALLIPPGTPPGTYRLQVAWAPAGGGAPLTMEAAAGQGQYLDLAGVTVLPSGEGPEDLDVPNPGQVIFGGQVALVGYGLTPAELRAGQELRLETHWQAAAAPTADYALAVDLVDGGGQVIHGWRLAPFTGQYATGRWRPGEVLRGLHGLSVPGNLPAGGYRVRIALLGADGEPLPAEGQAPAPARLEEDSLFLEALSVVERPRQFDLPEVSQPLAARVGRRARLLGYDLDTGQAHPGGGVTLTLYWQALGPMVLPYKVFTHLLDDDGQVVAQHDGQPGGGCCPANTWAEGEVIVDRHIIPLRANLLPGGYDLVVGLYDEESRTRLVAYDGQGNPSPLGGVLITEVQVEAPLEDGTGSSALQPAFDYDNLIYLPLIVR